MVPVNLSLSYVQDGKYWSAECTGTHITSGPGKVVADFRPTDALNNQGPQVSLEARINREAAGVELKSPSGYTIYGLLKDVPQDSIMCLYMGKCEDTGDEMVMIISEFRADLRLMRS